MIPAPTNVTTARSAEGTNQLAVDGGLDLTAAKTSPGATNTFIRRAPSDMSGVPASVGGRGGGAVDSIIRIWFRVPLGTKPSMSEGPRHVQPGSKPLAFGNRSYKLRASPRARMAATHSSRKDGLDMFLASSFCPSRRRRWGGWLEL